MSDSSGGVGGVGGAGSSSGASGANAADASSPSAQDVAGSMVDAATSPAGVDTEALGAAVAGVQAADPAFGAEVAAAVESQLSAVDAARFDDAVDAAAAHANLAHQIATPVDVPATATITSVNPTYSFNLQGQMIDACGTPVATVQAPDPHQAALEKSLTEYDAHAQKVTGGPVSGPAYSAAIALGADQKTADNIHAVGTIADGAVEHWSQKAEQMHVPLD
jgi:hypothetical protein